MAIHRDETWTLTKFDVAERQLLQAIRLFFAGGDPVSIHTLAEAAGQVLYDIRDEFGADSFIRDSDLIAPEHRREWLACASASRNFFKHANRDRTSTHEFQTAFNHFSLFDATRMYTKAKKAWTPETLVFTIWLTQRYAQFVRATNPIGDIIADLAQKHGARLDDFDFLKDAIDLFRQGHVSSSGVALTYGLPK